MVRSQAGPATRALFAAASVPALLAGGRAALAQEAAPKGMPQLDFGNPLLLSQVVWGAVIFIGFYMLCARWVLPRMGAVIDARQASITGDLEVARTAKAQADAAVAELTASRRSVQAKAQAQVDAASQEAKARASAAAADSNARLDAQLAQAEARIAEGRAQAMGALREVATGTASLVVARLTGSEPNQASVQAATDDVLAERARRAA
ncbi:MAG: hypothetical protein ACRYGC_14815 [Janthinobacterium lividum]